jgi:hypothetical protein
MTTAVGFLATQIGDRQRSTSSTFTASTGLDPNTGAT